MLAYTLCLAAVCHAWPLYGGLRDTGNCNPLAKDSHCTPDPAFAGNKSFNFDGASYNQDFDNFWMVDEQTRNATERSQFKGDGKGLEITMTDQNQAPTLTSHQYLLFGKVTVKVKAAKGPGLVTTVVLKSDSGDEIDWELLGAYQNQAQSNYYFNGQPLFNTYNDTYALSSSSYDDFHTYTVEWTDKVLSFSIDGAERKTWQPGAGGIPADKWPQTPMQLKLGLWAVESHNDPGEIAWAGGVPNWSSSSSSSSGKEKPASYTASFLSVDVEDYKGWCDEIDIGNGQGVEYQYDDQAKSWADVKVAGCRKRREPGIVTTGTSSSPSSASSSSSTATEMGNAEPTDHNGGNGDDDKEAAAAGARIPSLAVAAIIGFGWVLFF